MKHFTESLSQGSWKGLALSPLVLGYLPQKQSVEVIESMSLVERMLLGRRGRGWMQWRTEQDGSQLETTLA